MGEKTVELGAGTLYIDDLVVPINSGLTTTEEELNDTAFPLKLTNEAEFTGTIDNMNVLFQHYIDTMLQQLRDIRAFIAPNNWRKMHGYPMRRKLNTGDDSNE